MIDQQTAQKELGDRMVRQAKIMAKLQREAAAANELTIQTIAEMDRLTDLVAKLEQASCDGINITMLGDLLDDLGAATTAYKACTVRVGTDEFTLFQDGYGTFKVAGEGASGHRYRTLKSGVGEWIGLICRARYELAKTETKAKDEAPTWVLDGQKMITDQMKVAGISKKELAKRAGIKPECITRYLDTGQGLTIRGLGRIMHAMGCEVEFKAKPV